MWACSTHTVRTHRSEQKQEQDDSMNTQMYIVQAVQYEDEPQNLNGTRNIGPKWLIK